MARTAGGIFKVFCASIPQLTLQDRYAGPSLGNTPALPALFVRELPRAAFENQRAGRARQSAT